jgi:hypothetical protein
MKKKNILCFTGSLNQTTQLHSISKYLEDDFNIYFTQVFGDSYLHKILAEVGFFDNTVFGKNSSFSKMSNKYIKEHNLNYDYRASEKGIEYDLIILSTDMIVPDSFRNIKTIWIQEGMIDPLNKLAKIVNKLRLPVFLAGNTSLNGTTNKADIYCSASYGYKEYFAQHGTNRDKIAVTGMPNFDNIKQLLNLTFDYKDYVLVATSDIRELGGNDDRIDFINRCVKIANGKKLIFKLHPNEKFSRAEAEIRSVCPEGTLVFTKGAIDPMIVHCDTLITQFSSSVYLGLILGKTVYSYFPIEELEAKKPLQNDGMSAKNIANIAREFILFEGKKEDYKYQSALFKSLL